MINNLSHHLGRQSVEHIEKPCTVNLSALGDVIWKKRPDSVVVSVVVPDSAHVEFLVVRYLDRLYVFSFEYLLLTCEDLLQKVLVEGAEWHEVHLHYMAVG